MNKKILIIAAIVLPAGLLVATIVHYFFTTEDANEGGFSWFNWFKKSPPKDFNPATTMQYNIKDIVGSLPKGKGAYPSRALSKITQVVVHHSATKSTLPGSNPTAYANFHVSNRGWPGIGYHFVIQRDGTIFQTNLLTTVSNHVQGANTKSIGICLSGNFDEEQPTPEALGALVHVIRYLNTQLGKTLGIHAHNEYAPKSCPGLAIDMVALRNKIDEQPMLGA